MKPKPYRSAFLVWSCLLYAGMAYAGESPDPDLETVRQRVITELMEPEVDEESVEQLISSFRDDGTWPDINYEDVSRSAWEHRWHLEYVKELGIAYRKPGSVYYRDPEVTRVVHSALEFWVAHDFEAENWFQNQIRTPGDMARILLIMDNDLAEELTAKVLSIAENGHLGVWGARPGGDLIRIASIVGHRGLFLRDEQIFGEAVQAMVGDIAFAVDRGDPSDVRGLQKDLSFHHRKDRALYTISYGLGYASAFADWASKVSGTRFRFTDESIELLVDYFLDGIGQTTAYAKYPDPGARNREISRIGSVNAYSPELPQKLLQATSYRKKELGDVVSLREGGPVPQYRSNRFFWHSEYFSHQRPGYFTSVRMYSSRNHNQDRPHNSEGLKNHHLSDGANFITRTGMEYTDIFPVYNWQKIPGTTVVQKPSLPGPDEIQKKGLTGFAGGVSDGTYGAAAFDFESPHDPLAVRKSWFFFEDEFVALGAGLRSGSGHPVATTVNQSLLTGDVAIGGRSRSGVMDRGRHDLDGIAWIHHDQTAYLFPDPSAVRLENEQRRGYWLDINKQSIGVLRASADEQHRDVFTLWLDHGRRPLQAGYAYIVVPGIEAPGVEAYRASSAVEILSNTPKIQAVGHRGLELTQIAFYEPGELDLSPGLSVSAGSPGLVMIKTSGQDIEEITVSDPSRELDTFRVKVTTGGHAEDIEFELPSGDYAGQSVSSKPVK
ncbi:MAG: polysaccharide lyase family 8 super-sandwich domain-containing protein [Balneolales bacterium]